MFLFAILKAFREYFFGENNQKRMFSEVIWKGTKTTKKFMGWNRPGVSKTFQEKIIIVLFFENKAMSKIQLSEQRGLAGVRRNGVYLFGTI